MKWIKLEECEPSKHDVVLIWHKGMGNGDCTTAFLKDGNWFSFHSSTDDKPIHKPTHWMPLPEPPKV